MAAGAGHTAALSSGDDSNGDAFRFRPVTSLRPAWMSSRDRGSVVVELVLLTPLLVLMMVFVVYLGRAGGASQQVRHAADVAARAASVAGRPQMEAAARTAAAADLQANGVNCSSVSVAVDVSGLGPGAAAVTVTVHCTVNEAGLSLLGANTRTLSASSTEVVDEHRGGA